MWGFTTKLRIKKSRSISCLKILIKHTPHAVGPAARFSPPFPTPAARLQFTCR